MRKSRANIANFESGISIKAGECLEINGVTYVVLNVKHKLCITIGGFSEVYMTELNVRYSQS